MTYIYALVDPRDSRVRYVGKSINPAARLNGHCHKTRNGLHGNSLFCRWIESLADLGLRPWLRLIMQVPSGLDPNDWERHWISTFRWVGEELTNIRDGGEGSAPGGRHSPETIARMRTTALANRENRARAGRSRQNRTPWTKGKKMPPEYGRAVSDGRKKNYIRPWNKGLVTPEETRQKISEANRNAFSNPETRQLLSERTRQYWASLSPEGRRIRGEATASGIRRKKDGDANGHRAD
jgi:hypothetical protein